jgi:FMN reductase
MVDTIVGLSGPLAPKSRLLAAVRAATALAADGADTPVVDFVAIEPSVRRARYRSELDAETGTILKSIERASGLVIGVPLTAGTIDGLFKHLLDLTDREALAGKPVIVLADRAALEETPIARLHLRLVLEALGFNPLRDTIAIGRHMISQQGDMTDALRAELQVAVAELSSAAKGPRQSTVLTLPRASVRSGAHR